MTDMTCFSKYYVTFLQNLYSNEVFYYLYMQNKHTQRLQGSAPAFVLMTRWIYVTVDDLYCSPRPHGEFVDKICARDQ